MPKALLLTNPHAGFGGPGFAFNGDTVVLGDQALPDPAGYDLIIVEGGDGTLQQTMTDLLAITAAADLPTIAVLPKGRTNMSAADVNNQRHPAQCSAALSAILGGAPTPKPQTRPMVRAANAQRVHYGWLFGIGAVCSAIKRWNADRPRRRLGADLRTAWVSARELWRPSPHQAAVLDGRQRSLFLMIATTLERLLFGFRPFWGADAVGLHNTWVFAEAKGLLRRSFRLLRGDPSLGELAGYRSGDLPLIEFEFDGPYTLDGELFHNSGPMRLSLSEPIRWLPL